ncbi:MAG: peptidylprolyl isomerase [Chloroflexi bacterium]|nr:peptidylprolyl isomerase [Chloroflexota bacterium]
MARKLVTNRSRPTARQAYRQRQRQRRRQRLTWLLALLVIALVMGIPAYAYYQEFIRPPREPLLRVNDTQFNMGYYVKRLRLMQGSQGSGQTLDLATVPFLLVETIEEQELLRQALPRLNIKVTPEEISAEVRARIQRPPNPQEQVSPAQLDAEFKRLYAQFLHNTGLSDREYQEIVEADLLRDKLRERLAEQVPTVASQVHAKSILVRTDEEAQQVINRLKNGEDFGAVATEVSQDPEAKDNAGDLGWIPRGIMPESFDEKAFSLEPGTQSEPVAAPEGSYIIQVLEKAEVRTIDTNAREKLKDQAVKNWILEERKNNDIVRYFDSKKYDWAIDQLRTK